MKESEELRKELEELKAERLEKEKCERIKEQIEAEKAGLTTKTEPSKTGSFLKGAGEALIKTLDNLTKPTPTDKKKGMKKFDEVFK